MNNHLKKRKFDTSDTEKSEDEFDYFTFEKMKKGPKLPIRNKKPLLCFVLIGLVVQALLISLNSVS